MEILQARILEWIAIHSSRACQDYLLSMWLISSEVDLLDNVVFARFLHCKVTFFSPLPVLFSLELSHQSQPTLKSDTTPIRF